MEKYGETGENPLGAAYNNFIKEPFRTYTRDAVQKYDGLDVKDNIDEIGSAVQARILTLTKGTPFTIISVVIGNIQYPADRRGFGRQQAGCDAGSRADDHRNPDG